MNSKQAYLLANEGTYITVTMNSGEVISGNADHISKYYDFIILIDEFGYEYELELNEIKSYYPAIKLYTNKAGVETMEENTYTFYAWEHNSKSYATQVERNIVQGNIAILVPICNANAHQHQQGVYQCKGGELA